MSEHGNDPPAVDERASQGPDEFARRGDLGKRG
jgi:hypothetical protein